MGRLLIIYVLSGHYVDVALVGMREPRFVELNNEISDDMASRIDIDYTAVKPPSTITAAPVINDASSEAKNETTLAISIGSADVRIGGSKEYVRA